MNHGAKCAFGETVPLGIEGETTRGINRRLNPKDYNRRVDDRQAPMQLNRLQAWDLCDKELRLGPAPGTPKSGRPE